MTTVTKLDAYERLALLQTAALDQWEVVQSIEQNDEFDVELLVGAQQQYGALIYQIGDMVMLAALIEKHPERHWEINI